jgi:hypothetical protein
MSAVVILDCFKCSLFLPRAVVPIVKLYELRLHLQAAAHSPLSPLFVMDSLGALGMRGETVRIAYVQWEYLIRNRKGLARDLDSSLLCYDTV